MGGKYGACSLERTGCILTPTLLEVVVEGGGKEEEEEEGG